MQFGTSLCWWANIDYPEDTKKKIVDLLFGEDGLQLTVARYNLGGGSNPLVSVKDSPSMRPGGLIPCLKNTPTDIVNIDNDKFQKEMLDLAVKSGVNKVELFSNSPPWWMTVSGFTNGATKAFKCNLKKDSVDNYAKFLVESYNAFKDKYNVVALEPFNEPSNPFWTTSVDQEGCFFPYYMRNRVLKAIHKISPKIPLTDSDEFSTGFALCRYASTPKKLVSKINVHGYNFKYKDRTFYLDDLDIVRKLLRKIVKKPMWMSEYGMGYKDFNDSLKLGRQIFRDLKTFKPEAWVYWQAVENQNGSNWGLLTIPFGDLSVQNLYIQPQYYIFKHFTRSFKDSETYEFVTNNIIKITNTSKEAFIVLNDTKTTIKFAPDVASDTDYKLTECRTSFKAKMDNSLQSIPHEFPPNTITSFVYTNTIFS